MDADKFYREWVKAEDLVSFRVAEGQTDLLVLARKDLTEETRKLVIKYRDYVEKYIATHPEFKSSLSPLAFDKKAPAIIKDMLKASNECNVGPMAGVAGAIAEYVGTELMKFSEEVIVENGGDIFVTSDRERIFAIFAGNSPFTGKIALKIKPHKTPIGVCTSSGTVGHSLSFGATDATVIIADSAILSDCAATMAGNAVKNKDEIQKGVDIAKSIKGVIGGIIMVKDKLATWGEVELTTL